MLIALLYIISNPILFITSNIPAVPLPRSKRTASRDMYSHTENWTADAKIPVYHNRSLAPPGLKYTHSFRNGKGVIAVADHQMSALFSHMQDDYNRKPPRKTDLVEEVHAADNQTLLVNIFVRLVPDINDSWDDDFHLKLARVFAASLASFGLDDRMFLYISSQHDPDNKSNVFSDVHIQSQVCVTSATLRRVWYHFQCLLQQHLPRQGTSKGWDQLVDLSAASDTSARLRMNLAQTYQPCPRCSDPRFKEISMGHCYWHKEYVPGEFRVVNVIDLTGIPRPHELRRVQALKVNEWLACSIRPAVRKPVQLTIPPECPPTPVTFHSNPQRGGKKKASIVLVPGHPLFTHVEFLVRNHFPRQWSSIVIAELTWSNEGHYSLYAEGLGSHLCMNPSLAATAGDSDRMAEVDPMPKMIPMPEMNPINPIPEMHSHKSPNQVWFQIVPRGWRQRCRCKDEDCKAFSSSVFPICVYLSTLLFPLM